MARDLRSFDASEPSMRLTLRISLMFMTFLIQMNGFAKPFEFQKPNRMCSLDVESRTYSKRLDQNLKRPCDHCDPPDLREETKNLFDDRCFSESTRRYSPDTAQYSVCKGGELKSSKKPCITAQYAKMLGHSFSLIQKCVIRNDTLAQGLYWMLSHESGFSPNIESPTKAGGVGQLIGEQIDHLMDLDSLKDQIKTSALETSRSSPDCIQVRDLMNHAQAFDSSSCNRTRIPPNPLLGMVWAYMTLKDNAISLDRFLRRSCPPKNHIGNQAGCKALRNMQATITAQSYNAGWGHVLGGYRYALKKCDAFQDNAESCIKKRFKIFTQRRYKKYPKRTTEIIRYGDTVFRRKNELQDAAKAKGIQCGTI